MVARSMVQAFVDFGMSEFDAWRCVHVMQGRASVVLLQVGRAGGGSVELSPPDLGQVETAMQRGAAWSRLDGGWQYLRRVGWCVEDVVELQEDLRRLSGEEADESS